MDSNRINSWSYYQPDMEGIISKQKDLERQVAEARKYRHQLLKKLNELEVPASESKLQSLRDRTRELDADIRKSEMHKELRCE